MHEAIGEIRVRRCACCGLFFRMHSGDPSEWGYAYGSKLCCSYSCMRRMVWQDAHAEKTDQMRQAWELHVLNPQMSNQEIARRTGYKNTGAVRQALLQFEARHYDYCRAFLERKGLREA